MSDITTGFKPTNYDLFADIYDAEYADYHAKAGDIGFYESYCHDIKTPVLDMGCGTGRIAIALAHTGAHLFGIDISKGMLSKAQEKTLQLPKHIQDKLSFLCADMRNFKINQKFDFAYIGFRSFMLLLEEQHQIETLRNTFDHLNNNGRLIISLFVPTIERLMVYKTISPDEWSYFGEFIHPNGRYKIKEYEQKWCDEFKQIATHKLKHITIDEQNNEIEYTDRLLVIRWTHIFEFRHLAQLCGFEIENVFGDYFRTPFTEKSKEMIWVLRKP